MQQSRSYSMRSTGIFSFITAEITRTATECFSNEDMGKITLSQIR